MDIRERADWKDDQIALFLLTPDIVGENYVRWLKDADVNRYLESRFDSHDISSTRAYVTAHLTANDALLLGIRWLQADRHVGNIRLSQISAQHSTGEVGVMLGDREAWGRGLATRAILLLNGIARRQIGLRRLTAGCYGSNSRSINAFQRAGYRMEAVRPGQFLLEGSPEDHVMMGILLASIESS